MSETKNDLPNKKAKAPVASQLTLVVGSVGEFMTQMRKFQRLELFITATTTPPVRDAFAEADAFTIFLSARLDVESILWHGQTVREGERTLTQLDALAQPAAVREKVEAELELVEELLVESGFDVHRGMWSRD